MATVTLPFSDGRFRIRLPRLCLVCGEAECSFKSVTFSSRFIKRTVGPFGQEWRRSLSMSVPLCEEHWRYFDMQVLRLLGCFGVAVLFIFVLAIGSFSIVGFQIFGGYALLGLVVAAVLAGLGIFLAIFLSRGLGNMVMCQNITERAITLINVHKKFAKAVESGDSRDDDGDDDKDSPRKRRRPDEKARSPSYVGVYLGVGVGVVVVLLACGGVVTGFQWWLSRTMSGLPGPGPAPVPDVATTPLAIDPAWRDENLKAQFLADLPEHDAAVGWGAFSKGSNHGFPGGPDPNRILFKGQPAAKGLSMVPISNSFSKVKYRLDEHKLLRGMAAMADLPAGHSDRQAATAFTCAVLGDGRLLWRSKPLQKPGDGDTFRLSVQGVKELELRVNCPGRMHSAWAIWFDPYLLK